MQKKRKSNDEDAGERPPSKKTRKRYVYSPADRSQFGEKVALWDHIGSRFYDTEDSIEFIISDVCTFNLSDDLFFQYHRLDDEEFEYSPCAEIVSQAWSSWVASL